MIAWWQWAIICIWSCVIKTCTL